MNRQRLAIVAVAIYVAGWLLTFGYEGHRIARDAGRTAGGPGAGLIVGMWWPVYWPFRLAWLAFEDRP
jgi:hypothetical protein